MTQASRNRSTARQVILVPSIGLFSQAMGVDWRACARSAMPERFTSRPGVVARPFSAAEAEAAALVFPRVFWDFLDCAMTAFRLPRRNRPVGFAER